MNNLMTKLNDLLENKKTKKVNEDLRSDLKKLMGNEFVSVILDNMADLEKDSKISMLLRKCGEDILDLE